MIATLKKLFSLQAYTTPTERERGRTLYAITLLIMAFAAVYLPLSIYVLDSPIFGANGQPTASTTAWFVFTLGFGALTLWATRQRWTLAQYGPILLYYIVNIVPRWPTGLEQSAPFAFMVLLGGAIFGLYGALAMMFVAVGTMIAYITLVPAVFTNFPPFEPSRLGFHAFDLLIALAFVYIFLRLAMAREEESEAASSRARVQLAQITTSIAGRLNRASLPALLSGAVDLIRDSYPDMYHVQIFLVDAERRAAALAASTGEVGQLLMARGHALGVGSQSVIGQVSAAGEPVIARAGERGGVHRRNELLPETAAEAAFPLRAGDEIIGVLDLQSRRGTAFSPGELPIFQSLADSVAVVIDNVRLNEETRLRLVENERLLAEAQAAVHEVDTLNRQLTGRGWQDFMAGHGETAYTFDAAAGQLDASADWTPTLAEALEADRVVQTTTGDGTVVSVPLRVRGQVIGAMEFELPEGELDAGGLALLQQVSERLGISLDSLRSFEQARELAAQNERVSDISARYQQVTTIDDLLRITLDELSETLGANRSAIRLGSAPAPAEPVANGALS